MIRLVVAALTIYIGALLSASSYLSSSPYFTLVSGAGRERTAAARATPAPDNRAAKARGGHALELRIAGANTPHR